MNRFFGYWKTNQGIIILFMLIITFESSLLLYERQNRDLPGLVVTGISIVIPCITTICSSKKKNGFLPKRGKFFCLFTEEYFDSSGDSIDILSRENHTNTLKQYVNELAQNYQEGKLNCIFLTGESGAGKSVLLRKLLEPSIQKEYDVHYYRTDDKYAAFELFLDVEDTHVIILDQFDSVVDNASVKNELLKAIEGEFGHCIFIFAFPMEKWAKVNKFLTKNLHKQQRSGNLNYKEYFLETDKNDIKAAAKKIAQYIKSRSDLTSFDWHTVLECVEDYDVETHSFRSNRKYCTEELYLLCAILAAIQADEKPYVSLFIIGSILENIEVENLHKYIEDPEELIIKYLNNWVAKFTNQTNAKAILHLLTDNKKYLAKDFYRITFEQSTDNYTSALSENIFVSCSKTESFTLIHKYASKKIQEYCDDLSVTLSPEIKENVNYYRTQVKINSRHGSKLAERIDGRRDNYSKLQKWIPIHCVVLLFVTGAIELIVNLIPSFKIEISGMDRYMRMLISLSCGASVYYIYVGCLRLLALFSWPVYFCPATVGTFAIWLCYIHPNSWGVFIGITLIIYSFAFLYVWYATKEKKFLHTFVIFLIIGGLIILLGIYYNQIAYNVYLTGLEINNVGYMSIPFVFQGLYIIFISYAIFTHANQEYTLIRIGYINKM